MIGISKPKLEIKFVFKVVRDNLTAIISRLVIRYIQLSLSVLLNFEQHMNFSNQMMNLKRSEARIFIMNVHSGYAKPVLRTAAKLGLVGPDYGWVVTDGTIKDAVSFSGVKSVEKGR